MSLEMLEKNPIDSTENESTWDVLGSDQGHPPVGHLFS